MKIKHYTIKQLHKYPPEMIDQWEITLDLIPNFFERIILHKKETTAQLIGSCTHWEWSNGLPANYSWKIWAHKLINSVDSY